MRNVTPPPRIPSVWALIVCLPAVGVLLAMMITRSLTPLYWAGIPVLLFYGLFSMWCGSWNLRRIRKAGGTFLWQQEPSMWFGFVLVVISLLVLLQRLFF